LRLLLEVTIYHEVTERRPRACGRSSSGSSSAASTHMARGAASVGVTTMRAHKLDRNNSDESPSGRDLALRRVVGMGCQKALPLAIYKGTFFIYEDGVWKHHFSEEETAIFMPDVSFGDFAGFQGGELSLSYSGSHNYWTRVW
jgi:hypothetical protein